MSTLYRCTKLVTYAASSVFAMGYAFSAPRAPLRAADSRVLKPLRKANHGDRYLGRVPAAFSA
jgi:hypothetical protein